MKETEYLNTDELTQEEADFIFNTLEDDEKKEEVYFPELDDVWT